MFNESEKVLWILKYKESKRKKNKRNEVIKNEKAQIVGFL